MTISSQEWESVIKLVHKHLPQPEIYEDVVVDVDDMGKAVFTSQFADVPIVCLADVQQFQLYSGVASDPTTVRTDSTMPEIGDRVVVARIAGSNVLRCLGISKRVKEWKQSENAVVEQPEVFPVGFVWISVVSTNPATLLGYGTWVPFATGRTLVGIDSGDTDFDTVEETRGSKTHTLVTGEMPVHTHLQDEHNHTQNAHSHPASNSQNFLTQNSTVALGSGGTVRFLPQDGGANTGNQTAVNIPVTAVNQNAGGGSAHNNIQPSIVVYMFKRTA
jgi:microcystin-dependent protein